MSTDPSHHCAPPRPGRPVGPRWRRLRTALILAASLQPLVVAAVWGAYARTNAWNQWLSRISGGSGASEVVEGGLGSPAASEPGLAWQGGGRVALGDFSVRMFDPVTRVTLRVDFRLEGLTSCDDTESFDAFCKMYQRFVREQVMVSVRNCELEDLTDPELNLLKRGIVARVNLALGEPFFRSVEIKDFALFESVDHSGFVRHTPEEGTDAAAR